MSPNENTWLQQARSATKINAGNKTNEVASSALPLGWTRLGDRKRSKTDDPKKAGAPDGDDDDFRCCGRKGCRHVRPRIETSKNEPRLLRRRYSGKVVVCLLDTDPRWFQGYFFVKGREHQPWSLLATRQEIDECLACAEGGYRVVDVTVTVPASSSPPPGATKSSSSSQQKHCLRKVDWTGADMMELRSSHVVMRTERLATGTAAEPLAQQVFGSLFRRIQRETQGNNNENDTKSSGEKECSPLELFPDLAIVAGDLSLSLPIDDANERDLYEHMFSSTSL